MRLLAICILALSVLMGCQKHEAVPVPEETEVTEVTPVAAGLEEKDFHSKTAPLTGLPAKEPPDTRPVAVMINNHQKAKPQSGLDKADIVYELLAEGNITRFLAIYQSEKPVRVGPVRSARDYYVDLSKGYGALYICHGWSPEAKEMLEGDEMDSLNGLFYDGTLFERVAFREAPHNSYITYENIERGASVKGYSMKQVVEPLLFIDKTEGQHVKEVTIHYTTNMQTYIQYIYDEKQGNYKRYDNNMETVDFETSRPIRLDNILVVEANHQVIDEKGRRDIDLLSGGKGYLLQKGFINEIEWKNVSNRILPFKEGEPVPFVRGKTWINVIPSSPGLEEGVLIRSE